MSISKIDFSSTTAVVLHPTAMGAITQLWAGTSPEAVNLNGKYLVPWACEGRKETKDVALGEKLWTLAQRSSKGYVICITLFLMLLPFIFSGRIVGT